MGNQFLTLSLLLVIVCVCVSVITTKLNPKQAVVSPSDDSDFDSAIPTEIHGVKIFRQASDTKLAQLGVATWPKWEGSPSKFPWTFKKTETMYFVEGKIKVYVDGYEKEEEAFEIGKGDVVVFPKDMKVVWEITEAVKKHYSLEE
uniref:(S)-ureidoglycine aminohydrolase cupin domain-containing protein n=1 Tax=Noccaea caerulescens TaxID=107243 RepID=A0A1J3E164_NOCCA